MTQETTLDARLAQEPRRAAAGGRARRQYGPRADARLHERRVAAPHAGDRLGHLLQPLETAPVEERRIVRQHACGWSPPRPTATAMPSSSAPFPRDRRATRASRTCFAAEELGPETLGELVETIRRRCGKRTRNVVHQAAARRRRRGLRGEGDSKRPRKWCGPPDPRARPARSKRPPTCCITFSSCCGANSIELGDVARELAAQRRS